MTLTPLVSNFWHGHHSVADGFDVSVVGFVKDEIEPPHGRREGKIQLGMGKAAHY